MRANTKRRSAQVVRQPKAKQTKELGRRIRLVLVLHLSHRLIVNGLCWCLSDRPPRKKKNLPGTDRGRKKEGVHLRSSKSLLDQEFMALFDNAIIVSMSLLEQVLDGPWSTMRVF